MPHAVHMFLEQASRGLLDGCSFHRNAGHVIQGGPVANHLNPGVNLMKPFKDADLASVIFQEYHEDYPHKKYTLGYGAYINSITTFHQLVLYYYFEDFFHNIFLNFRHTLLIAHQQLEDQVVLTFMFRPSITH